MGREKNTDWNSVAKTKHNRDYRDMRYETESWMFRKERENQKSTKNGAG